ncbi:16S rRNA m3U1498 methyltransferase [Campylobacter blaseri]|uniref:Ribosomal RNA small subunit methyltransferase E n=1 Tax=Campylobacter blaseri TaxID=2042961 RepID=A0A2P8R100_9BACT|nr:16S rRNA (uracil(1498)-N(3))-methyltransferase [Campylobacter blaseri]PSM52178.1 16S rRNA (uracil(1498)-N(3))-methyltransferase [Campylobacter blaseri]PSM53944.1 16S rRNA (uracil(1498)-N(3))-methyltransferase [Campylobacter blaseri]QKF85381.1 16S rRNA m3U1498 methyltransferase [Campylobacter blaseri]
MVFLYSKNCSDEYLQIENEQFKHLRARRVKVGDRLDVRNLKDGYNYIYEIREILRKSINLELIFKNSVEDKKSNISIAWAVVEDSVIEKTLPSLNEIGVERLIFVYCDFSQKNIKLNFERFERILISSSQQCGRNSILEMEICQSSDELKDKFSKISLVDFGGENIDNANKDEILFIGPEGGFSKREKNMFEKKYALNSPYILRSNTAILAATSKMIL